MREAETPKLIIFSELQLSTCVAKNNYREFMSVQLGVTVSAGFISGVLFGEAGEQAKLFEIVGFTSKCQIIFDRQEAWFLDVSVHVHRFCVEDGSSAKACICIPSTLFKDFVL